MRSTSISVGALMGISLVSGAARADYFEDSKGGMTFDLTFHTGEVVDGVTTTSLSPLIKGWYQIAEPVRLEAAWGFNLHFWHIDIGPLDERETRFYAGNPYIAGLYTASSEHVSYSIGAGLGLPVANADDLADISAGLSAAAIRGWWDLFLWWPDTFSIVVPAEAEYWITDRLVLAGEVTPMVFVPLDNNGLFESGPEEDDAEVGLQFRADLGYKISQLTIGGRFQNVWVFTAEDDNYQASLVPYGHYDFGKWFLRGEFQINLTEAPVSESRFWGLSAIAGLKFGQAAEAAAPPPPPAP